jgi:D-glycero-D-manno-heptose 1,7-bisphosphate phosphatase
MNAEIHTVFLDRDGVINRKAKDGEYIEGWDQFEFLPGAVQAMRSLRAAGLRIIVVTNQRGVALGRMTIEAIDDIHRRMNDEVFGSALEHATVLVCPHETGTCDCRKPALGLYRQAEARFPDLDTWSSVVIGDSAADVLFGNRIGRATYLVGDPVRAQRILAAHPGSRIDAVASSLLELVNTHVLLGAASTRLVARDNGASDRTAT